MREPSPPWGSLLATLGIKKIFLAEYVLDRCQANCSQIAKRLSAAQQLLAGSLLDRYWIAIG